MLFQSEARSLCRSLCPLNTVNTESAPRWKLRRIFFQDAFSKTSLQYFSDNIQGSVHELISVLINKSREKEVPIKIDVLFGQLTVDVICKVGFGIDIKALEDSAIFRVNFQSILFCSYVFNAIFISRSCMLA